MVSNDGLEIGCDGIPAFSLVLKGLFLSVILADITDGVQTSYGICSQ